MDTVSASAIRIRVGQRYLEAGAEGTPSLVRVEVMSLAPLTIRRMRWSGWDSRDGEPYDEDRLRGLPLVYDPALSADELREALVGRTVVNVEVYETDEDWPQGRGDVTLTMDDGRHFAMSSWGYDAHGMDVAVDPPLAD